MTKKKKDPEIQNEPGTVLDENMIRLANEAIQKGERSRILMETLLSTLGFTVEDDIDLFKELKKTQDEYNEAIKMLAMIRVEAKRAKQLTREPNEKKIPKDENYIVELIKEDPNFKVVT